MNKNIKSIFLVLAVITLLATLGSVCAADDANNTIATDNSISDATVTNTASNPVVQEPIQAASNDNKVDTKKIEKEDKQIKTATKTVEVNNYDELRTAINSAVQDAENDEYIINLNEGTYEMGMWEGFNKGTYSPNIIIHANNQTLSSCDEWAMVMYDNGCNITIMDATIQQFSIINVPLTLKNVYLDCIVEMDTGVLIISDDVTLGPNFAPTGEIIINNTERLKPFLSPYTGDNVFENVSIGGTKNNNGNVTIRNSTLSFTLQNRGNLTLENSVLTELSKITNYETINMTNCTYNGYIDNYGTIIIDDNIIFNQGAIIDNHGHLIVKNLSKTLPYLSEWRDTGIV
ncbi:MAG: hypothetical protein IKF79_00900, partial [Methanosphaera sp.]|nr:hypothetical protein [Methanosphaera sp.]